MEYFITPVNSGGCGISVNAANGYKSNLVHYVCYSDLDNVELIDFLIKSYENWRINKEEEEKKEDDDEQEEVEKEVEKEEEE